MTPPRIALVGLPGSGKSTLARALSERLGWSSTDVDRHIESRRGRSVADIFAAEGEAAFRRYELDALREVLAGDTPAVIACGGGLITQEAARRLLLDHAVVVLLDAPDSVLLTRLGNGSARPLLGDDPAPALARLRRERQQAYAHAHARVASGGRVEDAVERIVHALDGTILVSAASRRYLVDVRAGALQGLANHLPSGAARVAVIADRAVAGGAANALHALESAGVRVTTIPVDGGEALKTWSTAGDVVAQLAAAGLQRGDCVVAMGGGTVGDLAGFVAAAYMRGIAWINAPTTLLAMVDSAVGGKTGVNLPQGKNLAGAFWQPRAVVCDISLLASVPDRAYRSALSEVVKYAMIGTEEMAEFVDNMLDQVLDRDPEATAELVRRCCAAKAAVVAADEREAGPRQVLNYGHTLGHALEAATGFGDALTHGEAVAVGMRAAGRLSVRLLGCPDADIAWQDAQLQRCGLSDVALPAIDIDAFRHSIARDKKAAGEIVGWVLLQRRGDARTGQAVSAADLDAVLDEVLAS